MHDTTWFSDESATLLVNGTPDVVLAVLTDAPRLASWNPAFSSVSARTPEGDYPVSVRGLLRGKLRYLDHPDSVAMLITIPGLTEYSTWHLTGMTGTDALGPRTQVHHRIKQRGPLAALIGAPEARKVPAKRLHRLAALLAPDVRDR